MISVAFAAAEEGAHHAEAFYEAAEFWGRRGVRNRRRIGRASHLANHRYRVGTTVPRPFRPASRKLKSLRIEARGTAGVLSSQAA